MPLGYSTAGVVAESLFTTALAQIRSQVLGLFKIRFLFDFAFS